LIDPAKETTAEEKPANTAEAETPHDAAAPPSRKAASNRENARKSTGPKTAQGKAYSRLNAPKHGILASQTVIATIEGSEERRMFEETVAGLMLDYEPVGCHEELLVQQVAACFWRYRRMLQFENRAAFRVIEIHQRVAISRDAIADVRPMYSVNGELDQFDAVMKTAGLDGITLPSDYDTTQIIRYEATITRTMNRVDARLKALRKEREAKSRDGALDTTAAQPETTYNGVIDPGAEVRQSNGGAQPLSVEETLELQMDLVDNFKRTARDRADADREAKVEAHKANVDTIVAGEMQKLAEKYQTKPKNPVATETSFPAASEVTAPVDAKSFRLKPPTG